MPNSERKIRENTPETFSFAHGLVVDENMTDIEGNALPDEGRRVFMGSGESALTDPNVLDNRERDVVSKGVRKSLLLKMQKENREAWEDANNIGKEHIDHYNNKMYPAIKSVQESIKKRKIAQENLIPGVEFVDSQSFYVFMELCQERCPSNVEKAENQVKSALKKVNEYNDYWEKRLTEYYNMKYKSHSKRYDKLFESLYQMSRDRSLYIPEEYQKNIFEYIGIYNYRYFAEPDICNYSNRDVDIDGYPKLIIANPKKKESRLYKRHTKVTMEGFWPGVKRLPKVGAFNDQRIRFKVNIKNREGITGKVDIEGSIAKHQVDVNGDNLRIIESDITRTYGADEMNLVADEESTNGDKLFSQNSARIYTATLKNGKSVRGMFLNGEFIPTADIENLDDIEELSGGSTRDKSAYGIQHRIRKMPRFRALRRKSITEDTQLDEGLRIAIRRSQLFRHLNSRTIPIYMDYDLPEGKKTTIMRNTTNETLAKRGGTFSLLTLQQKWVDGSIMGFMGGIFDSAMLDAQSLSDKYEDEMAALYSEAWRFYGGAIAKIMELDPEESESNGKYAVLLKGLRATTAFVGMAPVFSISPLERVSIKGILCNLALMIKNGITLAKELKEWIKLSDDESTSEKVYEIVEKWLEFSEPVADLLAYILRLLSLKIPGLEIVGSYLYGYIAILSDELSILKSIAKIIVNARKCHRITESQSRLQIAINSGTPIGMKIAADSQALWLLKMDNRKGKKEIVDASFDIASRGVDAVANGFGCFGDVSIKAPLFLTSRVIDFVKSISLTSVDHLYKKNDLSKILGDEKLYKAPHFDEVLCQETGINNRHYIPDILKACMSIDMHALLYSADNDISLQHIAQETLRPFVTWRADESFGAFRERITLDMLLEAVGAPSNWRAVLYKAIN